MAGKTRIWLSLALSALVGGVMPATALGQDEILDLPVGFAVVNQNGSGVNCPADGLSYTVRGHLVGPRAALQPGAGRVVTYYLHDLGDGEWVWRFNQVPGWDFAVEMAKLGHVSLTVDMIGYDSSGRPEGMQSCLGAQADVAHQVITQLRSGSYTVEGGTPIGFDKVALAGHSIGAEVAQIEAYSFGGIDALGVFGFSDQRPGQHALQTGIDAGVRCAVTPERADGDSGPSGYVYFDRTEEQYLEHFFNTDNADPAVVQATGPLRNRFPCGDLFSVPGGNLVDSARLGEVEVPVLLIYGAADQVYPADGESSQRSLFSGSPEVTSTLLENTGHAFPLEYTAPQFREAIASWLTRHGLVAGAEAGSEAAVAIASRRVRVTRTRVAPIRVPCRAAAGSVCRGQLSIEVNRRGQQRGRRVLGSRSFRITGGRSRVVGVRISRAAYSMLARRGRLRVKVAAVTDSQAAGQSRATRVLTLLAPRAAKR